MVSSGDKEGSAVHFTRVAREEKCMSVKLERRNMHAATHLYRLQGRDVLESPIVVVWVPRVQTGKSLEGLRQRVVVSSKLCP